MPQTRPAPSLSASDHALHALSPLDGRYAPKLDALRERLSEAAFMRRRVQVEVQWFIALSDLGLPELAPFSAQARAKLHAIVDRFGAPQAARIKEIEAVTNHDVKAVEYFLKESIAPVDELARASEFVHFACTSEDINNNAYALMLRAARDEVLSPAVRKANSSISFRAGGTSASGNGLLSISNRLPSGSCRDEYSGTPR